MKEKRSLGTDIMSVNATEFKGKILICGSCIKDIDSENFKKLSKGRNVYFFCPEMISSIKLGYKLTTIFRPSAARTLAAFRPQLNC
jgi:hypothetical protein